MNRIFLSSILLAGCQAPDVPRLVTEDTRSTVVRTRADADAPFLDLIDGAKESLAVAMPALEDAELADALLGAADRGVVVEVVTDVDRSIDAGIIALREAGIPVTLADGALTYFDFSQNVDVVWESTQVVMSHAFVVADRVDYASANQLGTNDDRPRIVFSGHDEDLSEDLLMEHNQVFGGTDATSRDAYSASSKNISDFRWLYGTPDYSRLEMWFGPQERVIKRVIDSVYMSRASVRILTDDLANDGLAKALQDKAGSGFDVQVVVGPHFGESEDHLSDVLVEDTPDVIKRRVNQVYPTVVVIDFEGGPDTVTLAMVATHDLYSSSLYYRNDPIITDQLIDGSVWGYRDWGSPAPGTQAMMDLWQEAFDAGEDL